MKKNKGMTIIELLISIVLISIVISFIMQFFLKTRNTYINNTIDVKNELSKSIIIDSVMSDFITKDLTSIENEDDKIVFHYNGEDKTLEVKEAETENGEVYLVSYSGGSEIPVVREYLKSEVEYEGIDYETISDGSNDLRIFTIHLIGLDGRDYSIVLYCPDNL